jgi:hypothetical protein
VFVQRLFSTFPNSWPGSGLLLLRAGTAAGLFCSAFRHKSEAAQIALILPHVIGAGAGVLLLLGLWTPISGMLIVVIEVWVAFSSAGAGANPIMLAISGASLAMIGPGAWSIDCRLFGRKHFEIPER